MNWIILDEMNLDKATQTKILFSQLRHDGFYLEDEQFMVSGYQRKQWQKIQNHTEKYSGSIHSAVDSNGTFFLRAYRSKNFPIVVYI